ncbi:MAG: ATP-binding protein [Bacteroidetes bacterium]|nr:ATP-binding protein [Bacteroidota bacterium]
MHIPRFYAELGKWLEPNKALIILGPRQVGKTTLLKEFLVKTNYKYKFDTGDNLSIHQVFKDQKLGEIIQYTYGYDLIAIDEAQRIPNIGQALKMMVDAVPGIRIIATGSSSFELLGQIGEPLTGRKRTLQLFPLSQLELSDIYNPFELKEKLEEVLVFGSYPEVLIQNDTNMKIRILEELTGSYLLKDILELEKVKSSRFLLDLLRILAYQIGSEVSLTELSKKVGLDYKTIGKYLDLLEKSFIIFNLRGFSRKLRKEITKKSKYYFYDNGVRNALIVNFNPLNIRNDIGQLWENFVFIERMKSRFYKEIHCNSYFWRTWDQKEIDLIEEREGKLFAYEFKWNEGKVKIPKDFTEAYQNAEFKVINRENYPTFLQ